MLSSIFLASFFTISFICSTQITKFVEGLYDPSYTEDQMRVYLRDFLIEVLLFQGEDGGIDRELFAAEKAAEAAATAAAISAQRDSVPGLSASLPNPPLEDDDDI